MGIMNLLTGKTIENVAGAAMKGADALILTDEERLNYNLKAAEIHLKITEQIANESTPTSISRRIIAMLVIVPWITLIMASAISYEFLPGLAAHLLDLAGKFEWTAMAAVAFYFGGHIATRMGK